MGQLEAGRLCLPALLLSLWSVTLSVSPVAFLLLSLSLSPCLLSLSAPVSLSSFLLSPLLSFSLFLYVSLFPFLFCQLCLLPPLSLPSFSSSSCLLPTISFDPGCPMSCTWQIRSKHRSQVYSLLFKPSQPTWRKEERNAQGKWEEGGSSSSSQLGCSLVLPEASSCFPTPREFLSTQGPGRGLWGPWAETKAPLAWRGQEPGSSYGHSDAFSFL